MELEGLKDIKPPVYFPADYFIFILIAAVILLAAAAFLIARFLKKRKKEGPAPALEVRRPAHEIAYEALEELRAKDLPSSGRVKEYYFELSDIARHYLEGRFSIKAPEMTTEEFLYFLQGSSALSGAHKGLLTQFLNHCDMVKFARYGPAPGEIEGSFSAAKGLVDETKESGEPELSEK